MMLKLFEIEVLVNELAQKIGAPQNMLPTYGYSEQTSRPHIEVGSTAYYYVVAQSGQEVRRYTALEVDELLYNIFSDVTFALSMMYAENNRLENQDIRRVGYPKQIELLTLLSPQWGEKMAQDQAQLLQQAPFDDYGSVRAALWKSLREQGYSVAQANRMAHEKYPYPNKPSE
ncbi:MAG: Imm63 family immunity protein [Bacteroidota bacterium]